MSIESAIQQDFKAYQLAHTDNRFDLATVFANRLLSNVLLSQNKRLCLLGYVLREAAVINGRAEQSGGEAPKTIAEATDTLLGSCDNAFSKKGLEILATWKAFHAFLVAVRPYYVTDQEKAAYTEDNSITSEAIKFLYEQFLMNRSELVAPGTQVPQGCMNEAMRLFAVFGVSDRDLPLLAILSATVWLYGFVAHRWQEEDVVEGTFVEAQRDRFFRLLDPASPLLDAVKYPTLDSLAEPATDVLCNIILEWRRDYIRFQEITTPGGAKPQAPISKETRGKVQESMRDALERDLFGKKPSKG
jgi:hypothetical protein